MSKRLCGAAAVLLVGCAVGPDYHRPALDMPPQYRDVAPAATGAAGDAASVGDSGWWEVYPDTDLQALLTTALKNNYDVKIAVARIDEARAQLGSTRLNYLPQVSVDAGAARAKTSELRAAARRAADQQRGLRCRFWRPTSSTCGDNCGA